MPCERLRNFLGLKDGKVEKKKSIITNYYDKIPQIEKSMHDLVNKAPEIMRINAWKEELSEKDQRFFEYIAKEMLIKKGYEVILNNASQNISIFFICKMRRIKRWIKYAFDTKLLRIIVKKKLLIFRDKYLIN